MNDEQKLIQKFAQNHGNSWPDAALARLLELKATTWRTLEQSKEFFLLNEWAKTTIRAGVAFMQKEITP